MYKFLFFVFSITAFAQNSYYVDPVNGNNSNNGLSPNTSFSSINIALNVVLPGDTILLIGTFQNTSYNPNFVFSTVDDPQIWHGENTIRINNLHGTPNNYITIKAYDNNTLLKGDGGNIFRVMNSSYLRIEGFNIEGEVDNMPLSVANALQFVYILDNATINVLDPLPSEIHYRDQDCVSNCTANAVVDGEIYTSLNPNQVSRPTYFDTRGMYLSNVNHIDILNNHIHHMPGGGLRVSDCEDILIKGNEINDCSRRTSGGTHGLVVTKATSTRTTDDYRIKIIGNKIHHNYNEQFSWAPDKTIITPIIDEGKGISLQRNQTTYNSNGSINVNWENGRIQIANNICYFNGYSGIHSNDGNRIDIINNTCYFNSYTQSITLGQTSTNGGNIGISIQDGTGHKIVNNISVIDSNLTKSAIATNITASQAIFVKDNIIYGTSGPILTDPDIDAVAINTQIINPQFANVSIYDFSLLSSSPAINSADATYAPVEDYNNDIRDATPDIGALEYIASLSILPITKKEDLRYYTFNNNLYINSTIEISKIEFYDILGKNYILME